jgi:acetyl-CoA acetyltransferase
MASFATDLKDRAAIAGIGATGFSKGSGRSELALAVECILAAPDDAEIDPKEVDGMSTYTMDLNPEIDVNRALGGCDLTFFSRTH